MIMPQEEEVVKRRFRFVPFPGQLMSVTDLILSQAVERGDFPLEATEDFSYGENEKDGNAQKSNFGGEDNYEKSTVVSTQQIDLGDTIVTQMEELEQSDGEDVICLN